MLDFIPLSTHYTIGLFVGYEKLKDYPNDYCDGRFNAGLAKQEYAKIVNEIFKRIENGSAKLDDVSTKTSALIELCGSRAAKKLYNKLE